MDLLWTYWKPLLHVLDTHTCFQNAAFIKEKPSSGQWILVVEVCASVYCRYAYILRVDHEKSIMARAFHKSAQYCGVVLQASGIEVHHDIGFGEKYQAPQRPCVFTRSDWTTCPFLHPALYASL